MAGGAGDNAASACGMGTVRPGAAFVSLGTSGVLFAANGAYLPNPASAVHTFCHALPNAWHQMGVILSATDSLNWLSEVTGRKAGELTAELGDDLQAPGGVSFLPYLGGERTPHNDAGIRGAFTGLAHQTGRASLTQAVLEGVALAFRDSLEALREAGTELTRVTAIGGGSRSRYWLKAIATALGAAGRHSRGRRFRRRLRRRAARADRRRNGRSAVQSARRRRRRGRSSPSWRLAAAFEAAIARYRDALPSHQGS